MRNLIAAGIGTLFVLVALAVPATAKVETIKGRLVDQACYALDKANTTNAHKGMGEACATECAKKGMPVALVTDDGKVYTVTGEVAADKNAKLVPHMSHVVELTGDVTESAGKMTIAADSLKMVSR